jgi:hypothetical protein
VKAHIAKIATIANIEAHQGIHRPFDGAPAVLAMLAILAMLAMA